MKVKKRTVALVSGLVVGVALAVLLARHGPKPAPPAEERIRIVVEEKARPAVPAAESEQPRRQAPRSVTPQPDTVAQAVKAAEDLMVERGILLDDVLDLRLHFKGIDQWCAKGNMEEALRLAQFIQEKVQNTAIDKQFIENKWKRVRGLAGLRMGRQAESQLKALGTDLKAAIDARAYAEANHLLNEFIRQNKLD